MAGGVVSTVDELRQTRRQAARVADWQKVTQAESDASGDTTSGAEERARRRRARPRSTAPSADEAQPDVIEFRQQVTAAIEGHTPPAMVAESIIRSSR
jgi:hypothetical protein